MYTTFKLHDGVRICHLDFTNVQDEADALKRVNEAKAVIAREPLHSVYTLTNVEGSRATPKLRSAMHELTQHNKPYVIFGAVVGVTPIQRGMLRGIILLTGRKLVAAESMEAAIEALKREAAVNAAAR